MRPKGLAAFWGETRKDSGVNINCVYIHVYNRHIQYVLINKTKITYIIYK